MNEREVPPIVAEPFEPERAPKKGNGEANRPTIRISGGALDRIATEGEGALLASGVQPFQRSNRLMRPIIKEVDAAQGRKTKVPQLFPIDSIYLRDLLAAWRPGKSMTRGGRSGGQ